ncbi:thioredoxin-like domain-containing protein [Desulfobacula sp.]|uniref:TlpA family protein disulfide reductase n=1 Tax=Desulfobacula sp. TaxID=2593537 RepID=UPI0026395EB2|nr:thioredoxin-like domain-containing protein [Desulfobacula sp.]
MSMMCIKNQLIGFWIIVFLFNVPLQNGVCGTPPKRGDMLPEIILDAPVSKKDSVYLGIGEKTRFSMKDVAADLIVLEILGVYCPQCHRQRPHINRLFHRLNKNAGLSKKVKFLGISAGATPMEMAYYVKQSRVPYPVLPDEKFLVHKQLNQPLTPYNMVITKEGQILYAHLGVIEDMDALFTTLKQLAGKTSSISK